MLTHVCLNRSRKFRGLTLFQELDFSAIFRDDSLGNLKPRQALDDFVNGAFVQPVQLCDNNFVDAVTSLF